MHGGLFWPGAANWKIKTGNACKTLRPFYGIWAVSNAGAFFFLYAHWSWAHWCIIALLKLQLINHFNYPRSARVRVPEVMRQPWSYLHESWIPLETITIVIGLLWAMPPMFSAIKSTATSAISTVVIPINKWQTTGRAKVFTPFWQSH